MKIEADTGELKEAGLALEKAGEEIKAEIPATMKKAALVLEREAKVLAPVGVSGRLRSDITSEVRGMALETVGAVGTKVEYAPPVELGTKAFWPPWGPGTSLARWAALKGMNAFLVARAISRRGIKAQRFLQRAFEGKRDEVIKLFVDLVKRIEV